MSFRNILIEIDSNEKSCGSCRYMHSAFYGDRDGWRLDCSLFDWGQWNRTEKDMERAPKCIQAEQQDTAALTTILLSCRSSVNFDCRQYERLTDKGIKPLYEEVVKQEAQRLFDLRDAIDAIAEQKE